MLAEHLYRAACHTEYDPLHTVILCSAQYMEIREVINHTQRKYADEDIDTTIANKQHEAFVQALREEGVETVILSAESQFPEQVFTRDIGFAIDDTFFVAKMARDIRQGEETILKQWLNRHQLPFQSFEQNSIEGGDVLIDGKFVWVGVSDRTTRSAVRELKRCLPNHTIKPIPFEKEYLHLDCVFNIVSPTEALIYPRAFAEESVNELASHYDLIVVNEEEQFTLGTNVFSIGNKKLFSLPMNKKVNQELEKRGFTVINVDISEIIKSGGSFRCITLPILREK